MPRSRERRRDSDSLRRDHRDRPEREARSWVCNSPSARAGPVAGSPAAALGTSLLLLGGCSPRRSTSGKRLAMPDPATEQGRRTSSGCGRARGSPRMLTGVVVWGLIVYVVVALPPPQRRRDPDADALQPADRDLLHDRAGHHGDRVLLLHRRRPERHARRHDAEPTTPITVVGPAVVVDVQLRQGRDALDGHARRRRTTRGTTGTARARRCTCRSTRPCRSTCTRPTSSTRSGCRRSCSRWTSSRAAQNHFSVTPDREGTFDGQCCRALRRLPLADALQRQGRQPGRLRRPPAAARRRRADIGPAARRLRGRHPGRPRRHETDGGAGE